MARSRYTVSLVFLTFFVISLLTNILGPIVPDIINSFQVSLTAAGFLAFAFFIAYGVMSIPAGFLVERFTEKPGGDGHHSVGDEESESQKSCGSQTDLKAVDDIRDNGTKNIGQQGDHEKSEEHQADRIAASRHELPFSLSPQEGAVRTQLSHPSHLLATCPSNAVIG